ncbi:DoxX family protein (plasmid) [Bernardetia sp. Wsw4-3y2]|uniref:DoxX family protein n=1 Tax=Bernardetia sp. Wsw4-3y2 TaxID=3127471 RepID=UPI0030CFFB53
MNSKTIKNIFFITIRLILGGIMLYGGYQKFAKPLPEPTQMITQIEKEGSQKLREKPNILVIKNYIFGMKQTGYFWQLLGICEIVFGLMILSQYLSFVGALMLIPITLHIFLFHLFLEPDDTAELFQTGGFLVINILLIAKEYKKFKPLLWIKP